MDTIGLGTPFSALLRRSRIAARMTQEGLAERSGLSTRAIQDMERGRVRRPHRESVRLLGDALGLRGAARAEFDAAARWVARPSAGCPCGCTDTLTRHVRDAARRGPVLVDLHGLGPDADPEVVLARLMSALGIDRDDPIAV